MTENSREFDVVVFGATGFVGVLKGLLRTFLLALVIPAIVMNDERRALHEVATTSRVIKS